KPGQTRVNFDLGIALFPKGPKGHGTQASGSGMGITGTTKTDSAWEWLKFVTSKDQGVGQVFGGAGSPGGRPDVWNDPKPASFARRQLADAASSVPNRATGRRSCRRTAAAPPVSRRPTSLSPLSRRATPA